MSNTVESSPSMQQTIPLDHHRWWPGLDGLRGVAVGLVVVYHLWPAVLPGGWVGVSVFFTLSGFLITTLLLEEHARNDHLDFRAFWSRRARRLLPAVVATVGVVIVLVALTDPSAIHRAAADGAAGLAYIANWRSAAAPGGYEAIFTNPSPFDHLWSLAVEEQIYLVFPLIFAIALKSKRWAIAIAVVVAVTIAAATFYWWGNPDSYFITPIRAVEVAAGAIAAIILWSFESRGKVVVARRWLAESATLLAGVYGLAMLAWVSLTWTEHDSIVFRGGPALLASASVALVSVAIRHPGPLSHPALRWLGTRSYAIYLWHWPLIVITHWSPLFLMAATAIVAEASMQIIETPARRRVGYGARIQRPLLVLGGTAGGAAFASLVVAVSVSAPRSIFDINLPTVPDWFSAEAAASPVTDVASNADTIRVAEPSPEVILVVGDSAAKPIVSGLRTWSDNDRLVNIVDGTSSSCGPLDPSVSGGVPACRSEVANSIGSDDGAPPNLVLIVDWQWATTGSFQTGGSGQPQSITEPDMQRQLTDAYRAQISSFGSRGAMLLLTTAPPPGKSTEGTEIAGGNERAAAYNRVIANLAANDPNVEVIDSVTPISENPSIYTRSDGIILDPGTSSERFVEDNLVDPVESYLRDSHQRNLLSEIDDPATGTADASETGSPPVVYVLGDSTAYAALDGLRAWSETTHDAVVVAGAQIACNVLMDPITGIFQTRGPDGDPDTQSFYGNSPCRKSLPQVVEEAGGLVPDELMIIDWGALLSSVVNPDNPTNPAADIVLTQPFARSLYRAIYLTRIREARSYGAVTLLVTAPIPKSWYDLHPDADPAIATMWADIYNGILEDLATENSDVFVIPAAEAFAADADSYSRDDGLHLAAGQSNLAFTTDWLAGPILDHG